MTNEIIVTEILESRVADEPFELVECKGLGHPDVLCDGIAESISFDYVQWCLSHFGGVLHHNFDKILLVAGESRVHFGGGEVVRPIRLQVGGRATHSYGGQSVPVDSIVTKATIRYLKDSVRNLDPLRQCLIEPLVRQGESQLMKLATTGRANDTISCCAVWPRSSLEETVYRTTSFINGDLAKMMPIGEDIKLSGFRLHDQIKLFVAVPFLAADMPTIASYIDSKMRATDCIRNFAASVAGSDVKVVLNAADDPVRAAAYITLTGTSAEMGDDGCAGRGNRANGIVAPLRPSSTPPAGKNPLSHPGKVYNVIAMRLAKEVVETIPEVQESRVVLFTVIGRPLCDPTLIGVSVRLTSNQLLASIREKIVRLARSRLEQTIDIMQDLLKEYPRLY
jgi:S-adenosylmethionine synthetase